MRLDGTSCAGMLNNALPEPTGTARYCFPFTAYVIGKPCTDVGIRVWNRTFPVAASWM